MNVLILWTWKQGLKYYQYFKSLWYRISLCNRSWVDKKNKFNWTNIFKFDKIKNIKFFEKFDIIIIAISPTAEQTKVLKFILSTNIKNSKIIIEKPVSYELDLLNQIIDKENIFYFNDEIYLNLILNRKPIKIKSAFDRDILEHSLWYFLTYKNFSTILTNINFYLLNKNIDYIYYEIEFQQWEKLINYKGNIIIKIWHKKQVNEMNFNKCLYNLLNTSKQENKIIKKNLFYLNKFIKNKTWNKK